MIGIGEVVEITPTSLIEPLIEGDGECPETITPNPKTREYITRFYAQRAMQEFEWMDLHVAARRPEDGKELVKRMDDLRRWLLKAMGSIGDQP